MKIIDTHMHLGECKVFDLKVSEEQLFAYMEKGGITASIIQPFPGVLNPVKVHDQIYALSKQNKGKIYGLASINPHQDKELVLNELERTINKLGFIGIKVHTVGHALNPLSKDAEVLWQVASKYKVPIMVHTGPGVPFSLPANVIPRAEEYPEVSIILAHAGFGFFSTESIVLAKKYENIYLETSWSPIYDVAWFIKEVPNKVMFGSDLPENVLVEIKKFEELNLSEDIKRKVFYENAAQVFKLKV
jgi:predicted TIM-barrel fold metal-dependent hydrolase